MPHDPTLETVLLERDGHVLRIGLNRPDKRNAFTRQLLDELALAYGLLESDPDLRCGIVHGVGEHFTAGLDLADVVTVLSGGERVLPEGGRDPWRLDGPWTTPVVAVAQGWCITAGIELLLAADIRVAAADTRFTQFEVRRGIFPFGGATLRFPQVAGWGNAMRWMLTGDEFDAAEAFRLGLVQEVAPDQEAALARATAIATTIAEEAAPLGVQGTLGSAYTAMTEGPQAAAQRLVADAATLFGSADAAEGVASFLERRPARFVGR